FRVLVDISAANSFVISSAYPAPVGGSPRYNSPPSSAYRAKGGSKSHTRSHINPLNTIAGRHKLSIANPVTPVASVLRLLRQHHDNPDLTAFDILKMSGIALLCV